MTAYAGRHPQAVAPLIELAETLGARVITTDLRMNFPSTHPLCPGIDSTKGNSYDHYIAEADLLLLIDYDFPPPRPKAVAPRTDAKIIHIDIEPLKKGRHLWGRFPDILIQGDSSKLLPVLNETVVQHVVAKPDARYRDRSNRLEQEHRKLKDDWRAKALSEATRKPISAEWLCYCLNEVMDEETMLVHMAPSNADALAHQIHRTRPGTIYSWGEGAGSMGWALGAALGAKLAAPNTMVVSLIGDGGFIYGCPVAALWSSKAYNAPFLTVICNNQSYVSIRELLRAGYGEESVSGEMGFEIGTDIKDPPDFATIARACGAHGQKVEEPSELLPALKTAIDQVRKGTSAVLDVRI
jgi:acetolactate synthase-1/2/3 large subunit